MRMVRNRKRNESEEEGKEMAAGKFSAFGSSNEATRGIAKAFREATVYGDPEALDALIAEIERRLADGWSLDKESEQRLPSCGGQRFFLFPCRASAERQAVTLAMCADGRRLSVTNILLKEDRRLSCAEYNSILVEFYLKFLQPAAEAAGLPIELSPDERSFESEYGPEAVRLLKQFSLLANKSITHPADQRRFMEFVIHVHQHRPKRDYGFGLLRKWLIDDGWSVDKASELIAEAELALDLLSAYDAALGLAE
jgi:hypothetical protein